LASKTLYVGNLNYNTMEQALAELFAGQGHVVDVRIMMGKGFGFVEMASEEEAAQAKEALNGVQLDGRTIRVDEARPRRGRGQREEASTVKPPAEESVEDEPPAEELDSDDSTTDDSAELEDAETSVEEPPGDESSQEADLGEED
jgi:RNA recognition motif-containing protein